VALNKLNIQDTNVVLMHISGNSSAGRAQPCQG
jgi:hypothetical protein